MSHIRKASRFGGDRRGVAAVEFAIVLPALLVLFIATSEAVTYFRTWYRLEQAAGSAAAAGSRIQTLNTSAVSGVFEAARTVADPYAAWNTSATLTRARTVVSAVSNPTNGNVVAWTCSRGDATLATTVAGSAVLPAGFTVPVGQTVLVVEIVNNTAPWIVMAGADFFGTAGPRPLHAYAIVRPRAVELTTLSGGCPT